MHRSTAYLLVFHGSRDPRPEVAANTLATLFSQRIRYSYSQDKATLTTAFIQEILPPVGTASLECHPLSLHQQIEQFCQPLQDSATPIQQLRVLPLFLLPGVHVMQDVPTEVALAQKSLPTIALQTCPYLGSHSRLRRLLTERMSPVSVEAWILLAHGSRRAGANQPIASVAEHLGAVPAYWSVPPSLEQQLQELMQQGVHNIGILPYFLFAGGITDAIAQQVDRLSGQFPTLTLHLENPLEASSELADLLVDLAQHK